VRSDAPGVRAGGHNGALWPRHRVGDGGPDTASATVASTRLWREPATNDGRPTHRIEGGLLSISMAKATGVSLSPNEFMLAAHSRCTPLPVMSAPLPENAHGESSSSNTVGADGRSRSQLVVFPAPADTLA